MGFEKKIMAPKSQFQFHIPKSGFNCTLEYKQKYLKSTYLMFGRKFGFRVPFYNRKKYPLGTGKKIQEG